MKKFLSRESGVTIITVTSMIVVIAVILREKFYTNGGFWKSES